MILTRRHAGLEDMVLLLSMHSDGVRFVNITPAGPPPPPPPRNELISPIFRGVGVEDAGDKDENNTRYVERPLYSDVCSLCTHTHR